ncbi:hypothetical protein V9T40_004222 [Parthenolecanium corni]|uniref:F-box domain-containing protein n=1 Tax=Parthenolecanium corni TaxID=536013 RepID=A0AAN9YA72_9HEMI
MPKPPTNNYVHHCCRNMACNECFLAYEHAIELCHTLELIGELDEPDQAEIDKIIAIRKDLLDEYFQIQHILQHTPYNHWWNLDFLSHRAQQRSFRPRAPVKNLQHRLGRVILGILDHLNLTDRKNVRLTCKRLYALCNVNRFCKDEKIIWSEDYGRLCNARPTSLTSCSRSHYNLKIDDRICESLEPSLILPFFEKNGAKVRSLNISIGYSCPPAGLLESLMMHCEELRNLSLKLSREASVPGPDLFTHEQKMLVRPKVTSLKIYLRRDHLPSSYFRKIISAFPNIKHLKIELPYFDESDDDSVHYENIIDDIMKLSSQLESLDLHDMPCHLIGKRPEFFDALRKNTALKHLKLTSIRNLTLTSEEFKALVSSQLETISFDIYDLSCDMQSSDFPLLPNRTENLRSLYLYPCDECTTDGIFGTEDGRFKYSINNLRKLEYLRICDLPVSSNFHSDDINKKAFILPRLKHVYIQLSLEYGEVSFRPLRIIWSSTT